MTRVRCLTCSHVVEPDGEGIGLVRMQNQPRYFHMSPKGCQAAERSTTDLDPAFPEIRDEIEVRMRFNNEKTLAAVE